MTRTQFRRLALSMTGATESAHMNHPDFRSNGRIFATLAPDGKRGMIKLTPEQQAQFISAHRGVFEPAAGAWGRGGSTMVLLATADPEAIGEAMTLAWKGTAEVTSRRLTVAGRNIRRGARKSRRS